MEKEESKMKINKIKIKEWINPEFIAHYLSKKFGEKGLSWLDSDGSEHGEWSVLGVKPKEIISCRNIQNYNNTNNPFERLKKIKNGFWIGWLSYEAGAWLEPQNPWHESEVATLWIASYDPIIKFNLSNREIFIEGSNLEEINIYKELITNINLRKIKTEIKKNFHFDFSHIDLLKISESYKKNILKVKNLISQGDIFQANLTTKCEIKAIENYFYLDIYSKIRSKLKAPFGGIIINNFDGSKECVISTSPERFLKVDDKGYVETRPIKGTRPRDKNKNKDALNAIELITNEKDRAENIMIVDILRNDLNKVCEPGTVIVPELLKLESYIKVHHLTSVVRGKMKTCNNWIDLLKACWPGGSITGAPKVRSCQRIFELEKFDRGPYCGSFIKIDWNGEFDSNILIRSFILKNKTIKVYAGCGIVNDSNPNEENEELKWKLLPLINSLK